jgi:hypothetical protein
MIVVLTPCGRCVACREVGTNGLRDLPDLLVWGGAGTRMDADVDTLLRRWTRAVRRSAAADDERSSSSGTAAERKHADGDSRS